ncbi:histone-lysine N-methyltransferase SETMAR [Trichonephila clavipes]|nr:histone-lysine N-methyltransferase SETMAR [Trichonephila clavipes]
MKTWVMRRLRQIGNDLIQLEKVKDLKCLLSEHCSATRGLLVADLVILNDGQVTTTTSELATPFPPNTRWFKEFCSGRNFLQDEEHAGRPRSPLIPDNVSTVQMDDNRCTYQMILRELNIGSAAIHKIIHEELHTKKVVFRWVPHILTGHQR